MSLLRAFGVSSMLAAAAFAVACSSGSSGAKGTKIGAGGDDASNGGDDGFSLGGDDGGGGGLDLGGDDVSTAPDYGADAFWADDPPPATCGDSGVTPVVPGGTPDCPSDKNREGCPCPTEGMTAACWPGLRKNRNRGVCHDGMTTCTKTGEFTTKWGPCMGYQLPTGTTGKAACTCFSGGTWKIDNLSPCFMSDAGGTVTGAESTDPGYDATGKVNPMCPSGTPTGIWSHTTLTTDCPGHFKLCYTLKAGSASAPSASDCVVTQQCAEGDYTTANVAQKWADLPAWTSSDAACAAKFNSSGGYGEMSVVGTSIECDMVDKVFGRVSYCSSTCNTNPSAPGCSGCGAGGSGSF